MNFLKTKTIRNKILIVFSVTFFVLLIVLFLVNRFFMADYFIHTNSVNMRTEAGRFIREYPAGKLKDLTDTITKSTGAHIYLFNEDLDSIGITAERRETLPFPGADWDAIYQNAKATGGYFTVMGSGEPEDKTLLFAIVFGNGTLLVLTKAMGLIGEASGLFFRFMMLTSIVVYLIGLVLIFFISGSLSRPIKEMKRITRKMANLEFDEKLKVIGSDEIADLTASVNQMADSLSGTIQKLNLTNAKLERELSKERSLEKMRRRFVSDVSHELKNPISVILGYADGLVQNVPKTTAAKKEYYGIIIDEAHAMNDLVKNLLDLSSYESGTFTLEKETFALCELIDSALERFAYLLSEKRIHIEYQPPETCDLTADRLRIHQVVVNLLGNAFKYVNDGGTIRIELNQADGHTIMVIANTGPLIPDKDLEQIWNSFYRVDTQHSGSGLGLAIVKSVVDLHNGSCRAYTENAYNCFEVVL